MSLFPIAKHRTPEFVKLLKRPIPPSIKICAVLLRFGLVVTVVLLLRFGLVVTVVERERRIVVLLLVSAIFSSE